MQEVTIAEAAKRLGTSIDTIRRRIGKGELKARKVPSQHGEMYMIEVPDEVPADAESPKIEIEKKIESIPPEIEALRKTISILETELDARRREVQELHVLLQQAQAALPPGKDASLPWWRRLFNRGKR
jgi:excisionase family DNA binding protein